MLSRMTGAARLDVHAFEDVEKDSGATGQALLVVIIVAIATGIGGLSADNPILGLVLGIAVAVLQWIVWAFVTYIVGTTILKTPQTHVTWGQSARTTGFAQSPGILKVLGFIPVIGAIIVIVATVWQFIAMVIGVRQALDYTSTWRAIGVVLIGFVIILIINLVFAGILAGVGFLSGAVS